MSGEMEESTKPRSASSGGFSGFRKKADTTSSIGEEQLKGHTFVYGVTGQKEKFAKSEKIFAEWAGAYLGKEYYHLILNKQEAVYNEPAEPTPGKDGKISTGKWKKYELELRLQFEKVEKYNTNKGKLFRLLMVQCQTARKNKLEGRPDYQTWEQNDDVVALLNKMKELVYNTEKPQYEPWTQQ